MENAINIQSEFEKLIEQLERLKSINELTTLNVDSSKKIIKNIDSFVNSIDKLKTNLEKDLLLKSSKIDSLMKEVDKSVIQLNTCTKNLTDLFSISFDSQKKDINSKLELNAKALKESFISIETLSKEISKNIIIINIELKQEIENESMKIIKQLTSLIDNKFKSNEINFIKQIQDIKQIQEQNSIAFQKELKKNRLFIIIAISITCLGAILSILF